MAARSIASLTISFGLVSIPVKLYSATQSAGAISFNMLHKAVRLAPQAAVRVREGRGGGAARGHGQGLRVRQGPVRHVHARRAEGAGRGGHAHAPRSPSSCRSRPSTRCTSTRPTTSHPTRAAPSLTPCSRRRCARPERCALGRWAARGKQYMVMLRPVEDAPGHAAAALRRRGARRSSELEIPEDRGQRRGVEARAAADRTASGGNVRSGQLHRRGADARSRRRCRRRSKDRRSRSPRRRRPGGAQVIDLMEALRASLQKRSPEAARPAEGKARKEPKRAAQGAAPAKRAARK